MRNRALRGWIAGMLGGIGVALLAPGAAWAALGMAAADLERHYHWEAGPEGTRLYRAGEAIFSPYMERNRMVGAIAELPRAAGTQGIKELLLRMTPGLRQQPAFERGTLDENSWELKTPDYLASAVVEGETLFVLVQQTAPIPPVSTVEDAYYRAQNDMEILQMALESYRARHWFRYPAVDSYAELVQVLDRTDSLPDGFRLAAPLTEFGVWKTGYQLTVLAGGRTITIRQPERHDAFWSFWQVRPYP